jgi:hypothetical protein
VAAKNRKRRRSRSVPASASALCSSGNQITILNCAATPALQTLAGPRRPAGERSQNPPAGRRKLRANKRCGRRCRVTSPKLSFRLSGYRLVPSRGGTGGPAHSGGHEADFGAGHQAASATSTATPGTPGSSASSAPSPRRPRARTSPSSPGWPPTDACARALASRWGGRGPPRHSLLCATARCAARPS